MRSESHQISSNQESVSSSVSSTWRFLGCFGGIIWFEEIMVGSPIIHKHVLKLFFHFFFFFSFKRRFGRWLSMMTSKTCSLFFLTAPLKKNDCRSLRLNIVDAFCQQNIGYFRGNLLIHSLCWCKYWPWA